MNSPIYPSVHIIILNWNGLNDTLECLESLRNLTYPNVSVQVVDNGSKNNEAEAIRRAFPKVNVLPQTENLGFCGGCNAGMRVALERGADFVLLLNNDALVTPDLLENLLEGYSKLDNAGAVNPVILNYPDTRKVWFSVVKWNSSLAVFDAPLLDETHETLRKQPAYRTDFACGCCMLVPTKVIRQVGLMDERYFAFYDEAEWCARFRKKGYESYLISSAFMYHKVSQSAASPVRVYLTARNKLLWMNENFSFSERMKSFPFRMRELFYHFRNSKGIMTGKGEVNYSTAESRAFLQGWKDYLLGRFGRWSEKAERVLFPPG